MIIISRFDNFGEYYLSLLQTRDDIDSEAFHKMINSGERMVITFSDKTINSIDCKRIFKMVDRTGSYSFVSGRDKHMLTVVCPAISKEENHNEKYT